MIQCAIPLLGVQGLFLSPVGETLSNFPIAQLFLPNKRKNEVSSGDSPLDHLDKQSPVRMVPLLRGTCTTYLDPWRFWSALPWPASRRQQDGSSAGTPSFQSSLHPWSSSRQWGLVPGPGKWTALWWNNGGRLSCYLKAILVNLKLHLFIFSVHAHVWHIYVHGNLGFMVCIWKSQDNYRSWISPFTMWDSGTELRSLSLAAVVFAQWVSDSLHSSGWLWMWNSLPSPPGC